MRGNLSHAGGGFYCSAGSPILTNCVLMKNRAVSGGGAYCATNTQAALVNCTFSENLGYGLVCSSSTPTVANCILWGDTPEEIYPPPSIGITTVTYCDVQGSYPGTGNFDVAPFAFEGD